MSYNDDEIEVEDVGEIAEDDAFEESLDDDLLDDDLLLDPEEEEEEDEISEFAGLDGSNSDY